MTCRICLEPDDKENFIQPCLCKGSALNVHEACLAQWLFVSKSKKCEICNFEYKFQEEIAKQTFFFASDRRTNRSIIVFGVILFSMIQIQSLIFPKMLSAIFFSSNIVLLAYAFLSICFCTDLNTTACLTYWKICTFVGFLIITFKLGNNIYVKLEAGAVTALVISLMGNRLFKNSREESNEQLLSNNI